MSAEIVILIVGLALLLVSGVLAAYLTAHRLDRLHIRTDLARSALVGALGRRHAVAVSVALALEDRDPDTAARLFRALAHARAHPPQAVAGTDPAPDPDRRRWKGVDDDDSGADAEHAENALGLELSTVERSSLRGSLVSEIEDAVDRVSMARRFYNDAVRDTRTLREWSTVRALRLAGRAPMPDFVELVDPPPVGG